MSASSSGRKRSQVDDFELDAVGRELRRSLEALVEAPAVGQHRDVATGTPDRRALDVDRHGRRRQIRLPC